MGSGSDYTAFLHHLGIASLNIGFNSDETRGIYHSIYDSFTWYSHFSDTDFTRGKALSQVMDTALLRLADAPLLPFEFGNFAKTVEGYLKDIAQIKGANALHLASARRELGLLKKSAESCESLYRNALDKASAAPPERLAAINQLLFLTERRMLLAAGLPGRGWFKNQIYAPGLYTGYSAKTLPGIREAAEAGRWEEADRSAEALAGVLRAVGEQIEQVEKGLGTL
jgi:N-acetylated-alpha-linked acidic dipeptidase